MAGVVTGAAAVTWKTSTTAGCDLTRRLAAPHLRRPEKMQENI